MSTYDHKQVLADYDKGRITPEMAVGHSLQHIDKLYEVQTAANAHRRAEQAKIGALEQRIDTRQAAIDRLLAFMEKVLRAQKKRNALSPPKADQS